MFEAPVAHYLNRYLGEYLEGIDTQSLRISVFAGNVVLHNLQLKPEALEHLNLPIKVKAGLLGSLTLKVPWNALGRSPVEVTMDRLFILASPKKKKSSRSSDDADTTTSTSTTSTPSTPKRRVITEEDIAKAFQSTKMSNVQKQESQWVEEMGKLLETAAAAAAAAAAASNEDDGGGGGGGMLKAVIDTVMGNLQLSITNIHIRYEDSATNPDHPFACGLTLHSLAAHTVDELGQKAFITNNPLGILRKATKLSRIAVYYDVDNEGSTAWVPPASSWRKLPPVEWDAWFLPGVDSFPTISSTSSTNSSGFKGRTYVLEPVDGRAMYTRMGKGVKHSEEEPVTEIELSLDVVAVKLTDAQYQSYQKLLSEVSLYTARRPHQGYRPTVRPSVAPKLWWRYAMHAVLNKARRTLTWEQSVKYAQMRSKYIKLYVQHLTSGGGYSEIRNMDAVLPECTIVMFRRMAHKQVQREKKKAAIEQKQQGAMQQQQQQDQGWIAWLTGTTTAPSTTTTSSSDLNAERAELNAEEYSKLVELVEEQKQGLVSTTDHTPFTLLTRVKARIGSATASLISTSSTTTTTTTVLLQGGLEGIHLATEHFPETLKVNLEVTAMGIDGPDGVFLKTGATIDSISISSSSSIIDQPLRALSVNVIKSPQDGSADMIVDGELTPSYVYYSSSTVQRVADFFHAFPAEGADFDFSSLSATATTQLEKARRLAAAYAASALRSRPHLKLKLALHAPKIAIPIEDGHGKAALALDLGYFVIQTDEEMPARLSKEEAALYECLKMSGRDVSAYLVDGPFDWTQHQEARREGGGEGGTTVTTTTTTTPTTTSSSSSRGIPLLGKCGMRVKLQVARFPDPAQPLLKLQPSIPILHFHISPGRIQRLLRVLKGAFPPPPIPPASTTTSLPTPSGTTTAADTTTGVVDGSTAWKLHTDLEGAVQVLTWTGLGRSSAVWSSRHAYIYQGRLLVYDSDDRLTDDTPLWSDGLKIMHLSNNNNNTDSSSSKRVVALAGEHVKMEELSKEMTYSRNPPLLLRLPNEEEAGVWYRKLLVSQQSMRQEILDDSTAATDETSSIMSSSSFSSLDRQASLPSHMMMPTTTEDVFRKKRLVQIEAQMGEVALYACGRAPSDWWPPSENDDDDDSGGGGTSGGTINDEDSEVVNVDQEVSLILLRASGGALSFEYSDIGMTFKTALGALEIEDLLVGPRCQEHRYLLQSVDDDSDVLEVDEDLFYDPQGSSTTGTGTCPPTPPTATPPIPNDDDDDFGDMALSPRVSAYMSRALSTCRLLSTEEQEKEEEEKEEDVVLGPGHSQRIKQEAGRRGVALISFKLRQPGTPEYEDCDAQMEVSLDSIYFYCNRPTLAALISFGLDIYGSYLTVFPPPPVDGGGDEEGQQEGEGEEVVESAEGFGILSPTGDDDNDDTSSSTATNTTTTSPAAATITTKRRVFSLRLSLGSLHAMLNYEGSQCTTLGRACVQDFDFLLDVHPDTSYHIKSSLGNIQAFNGSLEEGHPYHQICGLRPGSTTSLVSFQFDQCLASSSSSSSSGGTTTTGHERVPCGQGHYTLKACLSELQVVFLYRFVQEVMQYIEVFLAMRLPPLYQAGDADMASGITAAATDASAQSAATLEPFVLLLDVEMNAPVIKMPKHSHSMDSIEYDLGTLQLHNTILKNNNDVLIDQSDVTFSGMECVFINGGQRGKNVISNDADGWKLQWQRPLVREQRGSTLPAFDLAVNIPQITARLSDLEYMSLISVAVTNTSEEVVLPKGAQWVQQHHITPIITTNDNDSGSDAEGEIEVELDHWETATSTMRASTSMALASSTSKQTATRPPFPPLPTTPTITKTSSLPFVCVSIDMAGAELEVHRHIAGLPDAQPLARFLIANLNVTFANDESGAMKVSLCLPKVEARDLRPEIPPEQSLVISSGSKASFLMLDWSATPEMVKQSLSINLQKPLFVAELSFLLAVTKFVYPGLSVGTTNAVPYITGDILLQGDTGTITGTTTGTTSINGVYKATEDLWLSPSVRLLADRPGASSFTYDGQGRRIILPSKAHLGEQLPLILIGGGKQLRLKNVTIVNSSALPACLQLGPGARMHAEHSDGVVMIDHHHHHHDGEGDRGTGKDIGHLGLHKLSLHDGGGGGEGEGASPPSPPMKAAAALKSLSPISTDLPPAAAIITTLDLVVRSVGMGLQVMHYEYGNTSNSEERNAGRGKDQPSQPPKETSSSSSSIKFIELISAKMDLEASYHSEQEEEAMSRHQHGSIELQGLRVETRIISDPLGQYTERAQHKKNKGKKHRTVLKPCKISFKYDVLSFLDNDDNGDKEEDSIDLSLTTTSLRLNISPDTLAMMIAMTASAIQPLLQPLPTHPIIHCNQFERIWCFDPASFIQQEQRVALSVSVTGAGAEGGITAWRAKAPVGYCPVGDIITAGTSQPSFEVLAVALNSGIAAYPTGYTMIWSQGGTGTAGRAVIWRPIPPPDYTALGDVVTIVMMDSGGEPSSHSPTAAAAAATGQLLPSPPGLDRVVCVRSDVLVECSVGECLKLPPLMVRPGSATTTRQLYKSMPPVELWTLDNAVGTFWACPCVEEEEGDDDVNKRDQHQQEDVVIRAFDLRSPLGVTPASLLEGSIAEYETITDKLGSGTTIGQEEKQQGGGGGKMDPASQLESSTKAKLKLIKQPKQLYQTFQQIRRERTITATQATVFTTVHDFQRIWTEFGRASNGEGLTVWRPIVPPGFCSLGDCLVRGIEPPPGVVAIKERPHDHRQFSSSSSSSAAAGSSSSGATLPLCSPPRAYELVWTDHTSLEASRLNVWKPIPFPGYVSVGYVATVGGKPSKNVVRCVRADVAVPARLNAPLMYTRSERRMFPPMTAWMTDDKLKTFVVVASDKPGTLPPQEAWRLKPNFHLLEQVGGELTTGTSSTTSATTRTTAAGSSSFKQRRKTPSPSSLGGVNIVVRTGPSSLLIFGAQQIPLLQLDFGSIAAGIHGPSRNVVQAYVGLRMGVWAYNNTIRHWEPAVEPWDVIFKCDANRGELPRNGIDPGVHATIKASGEVVYATLAAGAAASLLDSLEDWKAVLANSDSIGSGNDSNGGGGLLPLSRASDGTSVPTIVVNTLGTDAAMELDYGDHIDVVTIPAGKERKLLKPIPQHPLHYNNNNTAQSLSPSSSLPLSGPSIEMWTRDALPHDLVLLDIDDVTVHISTSNSNKKRRLYCSAAMMIDKGSTHSTAAVRTRTVECDTDTGKGDIHERLVLPISLASSSNDTSDEIVEVAVQVWDATTVDINQPRCLGSIILTISKKHSMTEQQPFVEKIDSNSGDGVQLQGSYLVQRQWNQDISSTAAAAAQVLMNAAGCRALSLQDQYEGQWVNIPSAGHQHETSSSSITALRIGSHGIAVEESTGIAASYGMNREVLRSLCQVVNSTDFYLEVCLVEVETTFVDNFTTPSSSSLKEQEGEEELDTTIPSGSDHQHEEMVVVLENERWLAQRGWSPINLTPTDPGRFLHQQTGEVFELFPDLDPLPSGWEWDGGWYLDRSHHHHTGSGEPADKEGWRYGADWGALDKSSSSSGSGDVVVRQRRWLRKKRAVHPDAAALPHVIGGRGKTTTGRSTMAAPETSVLKSRTVFGVAAPGQLLPLPLEWQKSGVQLQVRPCIGRMSSKTSKGANSSTSSSSSTSTTTTTKTSSHDWSLGVSNTDMNSLRLESLDESITALLMCAPLNIEEEDTDKTATTHQNDDQSVLAACTLWFSLSIEADSITASAPAAGNVSGFTKGRGSTTTTSRRASTSMMMGSGTAEQLTDWKIVIQPPIILQNRLPVPGSLMVWEQQPGGRNLVDRQASEVGIGGQVAVHTADVRQPISFTFYPEGYDWAEPSPATLARGGVPVKRGPTMLGGTTSTSSSYSMALPDRFRLTRPGSNIPVDVFIQRDFTFGPWLMGVTQELDPGSVLARGIPMNVALLAPLWIVNATHLVIDAVVVPIQDTAGSTSSTATGGTVDGGFVMTTSGVGRIEDIHVVRTGDFGSIDSGGMSLAGESLRGRSVAPSSLEIMSYPLPHLLAVKQSSSSSSLDPSSHSTSSGGGASSSGRASFSQQQQQQQKQQKQQQQKMKRYGVRVRIAGSSWTPPMLLDATNLSSSSSGEESLQATEPVLIQAVVKSEGLIHEVLARIQLDTTVGGGCQVLRLESHVVLSNRTSVPLQLMLCRPSVGGIPLSAAAIGVGGGMVGGGGGMSSATLKRKTSFMGGTSKPVLPPSSPLTGSLMPENGMSFTQMVGHIAGEVVTGGNGDGDKANNKDPSTLGESSVVRPSIRSLSSRNLETSHWDESSWGLQLGQIASARSSKAMSLTKWDRTPSMSHHPSVPLVALPPDIEHQSAAAGMVFELPAGVCAVPLHLVTAASEQYTLCFRCGTADVDGTPLWSRPVVVDKLTEEEEYLMLPVEYHHHDNSGGGGGGSSSPPASAPSTGGSEAQGAVAMMRMSVQRRGPGAGVHIVLSTVHSDPPYLIENRTNIPLMYRQAHVSGAPFHPLPPWTAAGWVWQYTVQGVPLQVQVAEDGSSGGLSTSTTTTIISSKHQTFSLSGVDGLPPPSSSISSSFLDNEDSDLIGSSSHQQQSQLMLTSAPYQCTVHVGYWEQCVMGREGLLGIRVDGGVGSLAQLGRGGLDRVMSIAPGKDPLFDAEAVLQASFGSKGAVGQSSSSSSSSASTTTTTTTNRLTANQPMTVVFELGTLEISIIDFKPMEVATITLTGVNLTVSSGISSTGNTYRLVRGSLQRLQLDDQMPGTKFPVVLAAVVDRQQQQQQEQLSSTSTSAGGSTAMANVPLLSGTIISQAAPGHRGTTFYPAVVVRWPQTVQIAVSERLVWKLVDIYSRLDSHMGGRVNNAVDPSASSASAVVDVPVRIRLLTVGALRCRVSFQGDPLSRPRTISGGIWATVMDMANFHAAPVAIRGLDVSDISMLKSAFIDYVYQVIKSQAFGVTLSLVRNFGVVGGASRVLGVLSAGVAKWAAGKKEMGGGGEGGGGGGGGEGDDEPSTSSPSATTAGQRTITDVGDGILEGASAFGKGFMKGMKGLVSKPVQGAKQGGMEGAFKGLAKGMMGAVANPVSGALDALSAAAEGFDAQFGSKDKKIEGLVVNRHRLARVVGSDGRIEPIMREDGGVGGGGGESTQATWIESIGQALLRNTLLLEYNTQLAKGSGGTGATTTSGGPAGALAAATSEGYEEHFVCPNHLVLLLTNRSIMLVTAPGFAELDGAAEVGQLGPFSLSDVAPGDVEWRVRWTDVLAFELRWSVKGAKHPDKLVVHRRGRPGFVEKESLARVISCYPNTPQASQVKLVAQNIMNKWVAPAISYTTTNNSRRKQSMVVSSRNKDPNIATTTVNEDNGDGDDGLPMTMPCVDFKLSWHTNPNRSPVVSFWKPIPPDGYSAVGDVVSLGLEPPPTPLPCFKLSSSSYNNNNREVNITTSSSSSSSSLSLPATLPPADFTLIWRFNGSSRAVTMWMPVPPPGYVALGGVLLPGPQIPSLEEYVCLRADLAASANVFDSPIWQYDPTIMLPLLQRQQQQMQQDGMYQPEMWKVSVWQVDNRLGTFLVTRSLSPPPPDVVKTMRDTDT